MLKCKVCKAAITCHPDGRPQGTFADKATARDRRACHNDIDCYMLITGMSMNEVYQHFSKLMKIPREKFHVGNFDSESCRLFRLCLGRDLLQWGLQEEARRASEDAKGRRLQRSKARRLLMAEKLQIDPILKLIADADNST